MIERCGKEREEWKEWKNTINVPNVRALRLPVENENIIVAWQENNEFLLWIC